MALYLQMDGVDDTIKLPPMTLNKIVADVRIRRKIDKSRIVWDFRSGIGFSYLMQQTNGTDSTGRGTIKINSGAIVSNNTTFIPNGTRCIIEHDLGTTGTDDGDIFRNALANDNYVDGDIFNLKIYNGTTLVAHYDMTTGNVNDISGNGYNATLTGGTWLDDGTGGGGTVQTGTATIQSNTTFNSSGIPIRLSDSTILGYGTLTADSSVGSQILANAILNGSSVSTFNGINLLNGQGNSLGNSTTSALANLIANANSSIFGNSIVSVSVGSQSLASAILQSTTNVTVNGIKQIIGNSQVNGISTTSFDGVRIILSDSGINVNSDLQANAARLLVADSQLNGNSGLLTDSVRLINLSSEIDIHSSMTVFVGERYVQVIPIAVDIKRNELIVTNIKRKSVLQINI